MLKQCLVNVDFSRLHANQQLRPKCGEIFYESDNEFCSFQLVCCLCEMKHFAFEDFSMHIRNVHFDKSGKPHTHVTTAETEPASTMSQQQLSLTNATTTFATIPDRDEFCGIHSTHESEKNDDSSDTVVSKPLRVCAFNDAKHDSELNVTNGSLSINELESDIIADAQDFSEVEDGTESEGEIQSVFKKQRQPKEYECKYCGGTYTTLKYLNLHLKMSHPHPNAFKCSDCDATFDVERALLTHRRKVHTEFTCNLCDKVYKSSRTLLRHVQGHSGLRQYKCEHESCGKSFVSQHNLTSHRRVHSTERNYVCELCGYRSRYRDALIVHRRTHTGEKPFQCKTCARCFASKSLLNEHQAMHSTERPYKCDKCDAAFSRPKALYHHKHLHLGVKKFKCKICGNAYAQAAGLSAHMRGHRSQVLNGIADGGLGPSLDT